MAEKSLGGADTSMYRLPEQQNPLTMLSGLAGIQNALTQNEIQQQTLNRLTSDRAVGEAIQQATDPATGQLDVNKFGTLVKANPQAAYGALGAAQNALSLRGGQIGNQQAGASLGIQRQGAISQGLMGLLSKPDLSPSDAVAYSRQLVQQGVIPKEQGAQIEADIAGFGGNQSKLRNYVYNYYATHSGAGAVKPTQVGVDAQGAPVVGTEGGLVRAATASTQNPAGVGGRAAPTGIVVGQAPGVAQAQTATAEGGAKQGMALQQQADGVPIRKGMLANLEDDLQKFTSGPKADWTLVAKSFANRNLLPQGMQFDPQSIASQEAFNKQVTQLAQQQFAALGGTGTDSQLSSSYKANPNEALSKLGNQQIIQLLKGNEDALAAKARAWQEWQSTPGHGPGTYGQFSQEFNKTYNPRVYQAQYMSPQQIEDMRKNMSPADQAQFLRDYRALKEKGYISFGGGANGR